MIGKQVAHYRITEKLGEGGMGVVYKAEDTKLQRTVALKFLPPQMTENPEERARLISEARAAAALDHPNICTIYEIGEDGGQLYLAMAFVDGESLKDRVDRDGPMPAPEAFRIALQVAEGLAAAHEAGIVHRDIKSANVMVTPRGQARIMDFGLAERSASASAKTESSTLGTVAYGSPEQARGEPTDFRTDLWSFGVTLYEILTGQLPFRGDYPSAITYSVLNETPAPPSSVHDGLPAEADIIVATCLAKEPKQRYADSRSFVSAIRDVQLSLDPTISRARGISGDGRKSLFDRIVGRRALVVIGAYIAFAAAAFFVTAMIAGRQMLSPHMKTLVALGILSFLPTVAALAARARGRELLVIPANIAIAAALLVSVFAGKELGAATTKVSVTDEDGQTIERTVPRGAYRKRVALFLPGNEAGKMENEWVSYAVALLVELNLYQDPFVQAEGALDPSRFMELKRAGFQTWDGVPLALKTKLARDAQMPYFMTASVKEVGKEYRVEIQLHETASGRATITETFTAPDLFSLSDEIAARVKQGIGVPEWHTSESPIAPSAQGITSSEEAIKAYAFGVKAANLDNDWQKAVGHMEAAARADSTFAFVWDDLFGIYRSTNQPDLAREAAARALRHSYKLPERQKLILKANYYYFNQQPDKALALTQMMVGLYPGDAQGFLVLGRIHELRGEEADAIAAYQKTLDLDPRDLDTMRRVAAIHRRRSENDAARKYYERIAELSKDSPKPFLDLGDLSLAMADFEGASSSYERAQLIDPQNLPARIGMATVALANGRFDDAMTQVKEAQDAASSPQDRAQAMTALEKYYERRGQFRKAVEIQEGRWQVQSTYLPAVAYQFQTLQSLHRYIHAGNEKKARALLAEIEKTVAPPLDKGIAFGYIGAEIARRDPEAAATYLPMVDDYIKAYGVESIRFVYYIFDAMIEELRGNYEAAIAAATKWQELQPAESEALRLLGRLYRKKGDTTRALEFLRQREKFDPYDPDNCYELALALDATRKSDDARKYLERALTVWKDADPSYYHAAQARDLAAKWAQPTM